MTSVVGRVLEVVGAVPEFLESIPRGEYNELSQTQPTQPTQHITRRTYTTRILSAFVCVVCLVSVLVWFIVGVSRLTTRLTTRLTSVTICHILNSIILFVIVACFIYYTHPYTSRYIIWYTSRYTRNHTNTRSTDNNELLTRIKTNIEKAETHPNRLLVPRYAHHLTTALERVLDAEPSPSKRLVMLLRGYDHYGRRGLQGIANLDAELQRLYPKNYSTAVKLVAAQFKVRTIFQLAARYSRDGVVGVECGVEVERALRLLFPVERVPHFMFANLQQVMRVLANMSEQELSDVAMATTELTEYLRLINKQ